MKQFRDRQGRTRREQTFEALSPSTAVAPRAMIFIYDPVARVNYVLDPGSKIARKFPSISNATPGQQSSLPGQTYGSPSSPSPEVHLKDLGKRSIQGLLCSGTRTTTTLPAGLIGNDAPITTVRETWFSLEIDAVIQSKTTDPRFGTTDYRLSDVKRTDASPDLFSVPPSYKIESVQQQRWPTHCYRPKLVRCLYDGRQYQNKSANSGRHAAFDEFRTTSLEGR